MGSILYDYLTESRLFDPNYLDEGFKTLSDSELRSELRQYREFCVSHLSELRDEVPDKVNTVVLWGGPRPSITELARSSLYITSHVVEDPLFSLTYEQDSIRRNISRSMGFRDPELDRASLAEAVQYMRSVTPMVAANCLRFLPLSLIYEPPDKLGITCSGTYFADLLPAQVMKYLHRKARVRSLERGDGSWVVTGALVPCRGILVEFPDMPGRSEEFVFLLSDSRPTDIDEANHTFRMSPNLPDEPPPPELFNAWVYQSLNQSAYNIHRNIISELATASRCGAMYLVRSELAFGLLKFLGAESGGMAESSVNSLLSLDLPALDNVRLDTLMRIRAEEGEAFEAFRDALERGLLDLRTESDPTSLELKRDSLLRQLTEVNVRELDRKIRSLRKSLLAEAAIGVLGFAGAICSGWSLLAATAALAQGFKTYEEYRREVKLSPAFLFWKLREEAQKKPR